MIDEIEMYVLEKVGVNFEVIMERFSNNTNVYLSFVNKFSQDKSYAMFLEYLNKGDIEKAADQIHNIKGLSGNLGFNKLYLVCDKILYKLRNDSQEGLEEMVNELKTDYEEVITIINK